MPKYRLKVNDFAATVEADADTPLLYVLAGELSLKGPRFGCGQAQCGSCSVLLDGREVRSCVTPLAVADGRSITTLEGLPAFFARQRELPIPPVLHPLQQAMIEEQAVQCGYCVNGMLIKGAELLAQVSNPSEDQIRSHMSGHLCRCGTYPRVVKAIRQAAKAIAELET